MKMKKVLCVLLGLCLLCVFAAGCSNKAEVADFIDLTALSDTLRIAELVNITAAPKLYEGKTIKLGGAYQSQYYQETRQRYHAVLVADAAACCQQGLEFVWNGEHNYPGDYPQEGSQIEVTGVFGSYEELGTTYWHLVTNELVVLG